MPFSPHSLDSPLRENGQGSGVACASEGRKVSPKTDFVKKKEGKGTAGLAAFQNYQHMRLCSEND